MPNKSIFSRNKFILLFFLMSLAGLVFTKGTFAYTVAGGGCTSQTWYPSNGGKVVVSSCIHVNNSNPRQIVADAYITPYSYPSFVNGGVCRSIISNSAGPGGTLNDQQFYTCWSLNTTHHIYGNLYNIKAGSFHSQTEYDLPDSFSQPDSVTVTSPTINIQ